MYVIIISRTGFRVNPNPHSIVCLNVKKLLAQSRRHIKSLSDSNTIRTHNHLARKRTFNHLAKLSGCGFELRCCHLIRNVLTITDFMWSVCHHIKTEYKTMGRTICNITQKMNS